MFKNNWTQTISIKQVDFIAWRIKFTAFAKACEYASQPHIPNSTLYTAPEKNGELPSTGLPSP